MKPVREILQARLDADLAIIKKRVTKKRFKDPLLVLANDDESGPNHAVFDEESQTFLITEGHLDTDVFVFLEDFTDTPTGKALTIGAALDIIRRKTVQDVLLEDFTDEIVFLSGIVTPTHNKKEVLADQRLINGWPWPNTISQPRSNIDPFPVTWLIFNALLSTDKGTKKMVGSLTQAREWMTKWPIDIEPIKAAKWFDTSKARKDAARVVGARYTKPKDGDAVDVGAAKLSKTDNIQQHLKAHGWFPELTYSKSVSDSELAALDALIRDIGKDAALELDDDSSVMTRLSKVLDASTRGYVMPVYVIGLLYQANKQAEARSGGPGDVFLISANPEAALTSRILMGANPLDREPKKNVEIIKHPDQVDALRMKKVEFKILTRKGKKNTQMVLPLRDGVWDSPVNSVLAQIHQEYGITHVRDVMLYQGLAWLNDTPNDEYFIFYLNEVLDAYGMANDTRNRDGIVQRIEDLSQIHLAVTYGNGQTYTKPLVAFDTKLGNGMAWRIKPHPLIYNGVRLNAETNQSEFGNRWFAANIGMFSQKVNAKGQYLYPVYNALCSMWRGAMSKRTLKSGAIPETNVTVGKMLSSAGFRPKSDRAADPRATQHLKDAFEAGQRLGCIGEVRVENGSLSDSGALIHAKPGDKITPVIQGSGRRPQPRRVPGTVQELRQWLSETGYTQAEAAEKLQIKIRTLKDQLSPKYEIHASAGQHVFLNQTTRKALWKYLTSPKT